MRIEPAWTEPPAPWHPARDRILLPRTYTIDLRRDEDALWAALCRKTRQYIRTAEGAGVTVERDVGGAHLLEMHRIYSAARASSKLRNVVSCSRDD